MLSKSAMKVCGTFLLLLGYFGYLFPHWKGTVFTNNENLFHIVIGLTVLIFSGLGVEKRRAAVAALAVSFWTWGVFGFSPALQARFPLSRLDWQLDDVDNYLHVLIGLALAWVWLAGSRRHANTAAGSRSFGWGFFRRASPK